MDQSAEIRQISDQETFIGPTRMFLDDNNLIWITAVGEMDDELAALCREVALKFFKTAIGKIDILIDLNKSGKSSTGARKIWRELSGHEKVAKIALFGQHPVARVVASFVMGITNKPDMKFFKTEQEALAWLNK